MRKPAPPPHVKIIKLGSLDLFVGQFVPPVGWEGWGKESGWEYRYFS